MPIWLYRLRLGWFLGNRFVMLTHIGRKSGLPRRTVVEVVRFDPDADTVIIASGWGEKADWFLNLQKNPQVDVQIGRRRFKAVSQRLPVEEATRELCNYADRHPIAFKELTRLMTGSHGSSLADCNALAEIVPVLALHPN